MGVIGELRFRERHRFGAAGHADIPRLSQGSPAPQIRKLEGARAVPAVFDSDQRVQNRILGDWQGLPRALRPTQGSKIKGERPDFPDKGIHGCLLIRE